MPIARIEVRKRWTRDEKDRMIHALHESMVECLKIPEHDRLIRFLEYQPEDFVVPPGCTENYVLIDISLFSGRSLDTKRALYKAVVSKFSEIVFLRTTFASYFTMFPRTIGVFEGGFQLQRPIWVSRLKSKDIPHNNRLKPDGQILGVSLPAA